MIGFGRHGGVGAQAEIAVGWTSGMGMWYRSLRDVQDNWFAWKRVLDESNYNSYAPTKTGGGASGTWGISISGNAATATKATSASSATSATKLATARTINGTSFNGTANITTASWGTARNVYIRDATAAHTGAAVSVNGSANVYLRLPSTITAALSGNATTATRLATSRTLWGRSFNGSANVSGDMTGVGKLTASGEIVSTSANAFRLGYSGTDYGVVMRVAENNFYLLKTYKGSPMGDFDASLIPFRLNFDTSTFFTMSLSVNGFVVATGSITQNSDARLKAVTGDAGLSVEQVAAAPAVRFRWKKDGTPGVGSLAQYWKEVMPEVVRRGEDGSLSMDYGVAALMGTITNARRIRELEREIEKLKGR